MVAVTAFGRAAANNPPTSTLFQRGRVYRCEAMTVAGFFQQLAVAYLAHGYWFYVAGVVPERKDPRAVDAKLISRYGVGLSKWAKARRKQAGHANVQYLRCGRFFVLLATHGDHPFFREEGDAVRDARRVPVKFGGYAVGHRGGHPHVRIEQGEYKRLKAHFVGLAPRRSADALGEELGRLPYEPYAPVRRQLLAVLRAVNRVRKTAGFESVPATCFRFRRRICRPFGITDPAAGGEGSAW